MKVASTNGGVSRRPAASISAVARPSMRGATATIKPSRMPMSVGSGAPGRRAWRIRRSMLGLADESVAVSIGGRSI